MVRGIDLSIVRFGKNSVPRFPVRGAVSPWLAAGETIKAPGDDRDTIYVGKARAEYLLNRLSPALAARIVKNN